MIVSSRPPRSVDGRRDVELFDSDGRLELFVLVGLLLRRHALFRLHLFVIRACTLLKGRRSHCTQSERTCKGSLSLLDVLGGLRLLLLLELYES